MKLIKRTENIIDNYIIPIGLFAILIIGSLYIITNI